jgi:precorrin-6A synthase
MISLSLIGIGSGNPEHMTLAAVRALNAVDLVLIPRKGEEKAELARLRQAICTDVLTNRQTRIVEFDMPARNASASYMASVETWHDDVAVAWSTAIGRHLPQGGRAALLIWGDPSLYDSSLRIARRLDPAPIIEVVPGVTVIQALCASHALPLNEIGEPFMVTTGRQLLDNGWPAGADTLVVMLDGGTAFETLAPEGIHIWWGAYVGMPEEILISGPLADTAARITAARQQARQRHGWIMHTYILKRAAPAPRKSV